MHLAFATLGCPGAPLDHVLELAKGNDISGLELRAAPDEFTHTGLTAAQRRELRTRIEDAGLEILAVSSYVKLCAVEDQPLEAHLELAADLGARGVRVFAGDDPGTTIDGAVRRTLPAPARSAPSTGSRPPPGMSTSCWKPTTRTPPAARSPRSARCSTPTSPATT